MTRFGKGFRSYGAHSRAQPRPPDAVEGGGGGALVEPMYGTGVSGETLHVNEDWSNVTFTGAAADITGVDADLRLDGGDPWDCNCDYEYDTGKYYGSVVDSGDGFGSDKHIACDITVDPPCAAHGTGDHAAGQHWPAPGAAGTDFDNDTTAEDNNRQSSNGLHLAAADLLNSPSGDSFVVEFGFRMRPGADLTGYTPIQYAGGFEGKCLDLNGSNYVRYNLQCYNASMGWDSDPTNALATIYYDGDGNVRTAYDGICPPTYGYSGWEVNRDTNPAQPFLAPAASETTIFYTQNRGWGTGAGEYSSGAISRYLAGEHSANAGADGNGDRLWEAGWMKIKMRYTRETGGDAFGHGRIEMWIGPTDGSLVKVMEYLGDNGEECDGLVFCDPTGSTDFTSCAISWFTLLSQGYRGGGITDHGMFRCWSHDKLSL